MKDDAIYVHSFFLMFILGRQRDRMQAGEGQREKEKQNLKQAPGSKLSAQSPMWSSNSQTMRSCPEPKSVAQPSEPPRCPNMGHILKHDLGHLGDSVS